MQTSELGAPPILPKLPPMAASAVPVLFLVVAATKEYASFRQYYETCVAAMIEDDLVHRHERAVRQELSDQELVLKDQLKLLLLTKRFARPGKRPMPKGRQLEQLAQQLLDQCLGRPPTRGSFRIKTLLASVRRIVTGQLASEQFVEQIRIVREEIAQSGYRMRRLDDKADRNRVDVETAHRDAARWFNNVAAAVAAAYSKIADIPCKDRQALNELRASLPLARSQIDAGLAFFNAAAMASLPARIAAKATDRQRFARRFS